MQARKQLSPGARLRALLAEPGILVTPGVYDGFSLRLVEQMGFKSANISGAGLSESNLGWADVGIMGYTENVRASGALAAISSIPLSADGDTGYGNALNVQRTVIEYARAGAAAVMIEDQVNPKKCGHTRGKQVITRDEARMKIRAAVDAKRDVDILILARTDARAIHGFDEALARCRDFEAEGADIIFLEAPENEAEMTRFCEAMQKPCMANMVPGGKTPVLPPKELQQIGYKLALYPVALLTSAITAMQTTLVALSPESGKSLPPSISFAELQKVVDFPDYWTKRDEISG